MKNRTSAARRSARLDCRGRCAWEFDGVTDADAGGHSRAPDVLRKKTALFLLWHVHPASSPTAPSARTEGEFGRLLVPYLSQSTLRLKIAPVRNYIRCVTVNLQPRERFLQHRAVQEPPLSPV